MSRRHLAGVIVLPWLLWAAAISPAAASGTQQRTLSGTLEVIHADDFERGTATHRYALVHDGGRKTRLRFADDGPHTLGGHRVRVTGRAVAKGVLHAGRANAVADLGTTTTMTTGEAADAATHKRVAVVLMEFADKGFSDDDAAMVESTRSLVFGTTSVDSYFVENSFAKLGLMPDSKAGSDGDGVYGPYPIAFSSTGSCDYGKWGDAGRTAAGLASGDYDNVIHVLPKNPNCNWAGLAYMPGQYSWVLVDTLDATTPLDIVGRPTWAERFRGTTSHEFGHNLGVHHAGSWSCTDSTGTRVSISGSCTVTEYGDPFSVMGWGRLERHVNAYQKARLGWVAPAQLATASGSGSYTLAPLEQATQGVHAVRIPRTYTRRGAVSDYYYVEYREPSGFDSDREWRPSVAGVTVRVAPDPSTNAVSKLIDTTPSTASGDFSGFDDAALRAAGDTFVDGSTTVRVDALGAGFATVNVTAGSTSGTKPGGGKK